MKNRVPILLLGLMLSQILGFTLYFEVTKHAIQKEIKTHIKQGVPKDKLIYFELSDREYAGLVWVKKKEFKIGDNYYDVVWKKRLENGLLRLACVDDRQESALFANLTHHVHFNLSDTEGENPLMTVFSLLLTPCLLHSNEAPVFCSLSDEKNKALIKLTEKKYRIYLERHSPPPQFS